MGDMEPPWFNLLEVDAVSEACERALREGIRWRRNCEGVWRQCFFITVNSVLENKTLQTAHPIVAAKMEDPREPKGGARTMSKGS